MLACALAAAIVCLVNHLSAGEPATGGDRRSIESAAPMDWMRLTGPRFEVQGIVKSVAFSDDGLLLAVAVKRGVATNAVNEVCILDVRSGLPLHESLPCDKFAPLVFSKDGKSLWCGDRQYDIATWTVGAPPADQHAAAVSPDGRWRLLLSNNHKELTIWNSVESVAAGAVKAAYYNGAVISPDCQKFALLGPPGLLEVRKFPDGGLLAKMPLGQYEQAGLIAFNSDGTKLASFDTEGSTSIFDVTAGRRLVTLKRQQKNPPAVARFTSDGKSLVAASADGPKLLIWNTESGEPIEGFAAPGLKEIDDIAFSRDGRWLAIGGASGAEEDFNGLQVIDWYTRRRAFPVSQPSGVIMRLAYSPDCRRLAATTTSGKVRVWETAIAKELPSYQGECSERLAYSPDGWILGAAGEHGAFHLWAADTGDTLAQSAARAADAVPIDCAAFSPTLSELAQGSRTGAIRIVSTATGKKKRSFQAYPAEAVLALAYSPGGKMLVTSSASGTPLGQAAGAKEDKRISVQLWDVEAGKFVGDLFSTFLPAPNENGNPPAGGAEATSGASSFSSIAFAPDGSTVMASTERSTMVWELESGKQFFQLDHAPAYYSADGSMLFYIETESVQAVELDSGQVCWSRDIPSNPSPLAAGLRDKSQRRLSPLVASRDGRRLAAALGDGTVLTCSLAPAAPRPAVGGLQPLTDAEFAALWSTLAEVDAERAYVAMWRLATAGNDTAGNNTAGNNTVRRIRARMRASPADPEQAQITQRIADLDDDSYAVRQAASEALRKIGAAAGPAMRDALADTKSLEVRERLKLLLAALDRPIQRLGGEALRRIRAVRIVERIDTPEATDFLRTIAAETPTTRESREARAAVERRKATEKHR